MWGKSGKEVKAEAMVLQPPFFILYFSFFIFISLNYVHYLLPPPFTKSFSNIIPPCQKDKSKQMRNYNFDCVLLKIFKFYSLGTIVLLLLT